MKNVILIGVIFLSLIAFGCQTPCEKLDARCSKARASMNMGEQMKCGVIALFTITDRTNEKCQKALDLLDGKTSMETEQDPYNRHYASVRKVWKFGL